MVIHFNTNILSYLLISKVILVALAIPETNRINCVEDGKDTITEWEIFGHIMQFCN